MVEKYSEPGEVESLYSIANFLAGVHVIDLVDLQWSVRKMKRAVAWKVIRKDSWAIQSGVDGDNSVAWKKVFHVGVR